jgi:DNA-binding response OmpR family regulator
MQEQPVVPQSSQPSCHAHVLVAEDDVPLAQFLKRGLQAHYSVDVVHDGDSAAQAVRGSQYDLVILDLNLPKIDGMTFLRQVRPAMPHLPVLVLTGQTRLEDRVMALDQGADDCLTKPFSFHELSARIRALMRRNGGSSMRLMQVGDLVLDREQFRVERSGQRIDLTAKEFSVLEFLMMNARRPVTRAMLMEHVWKAPYDASTNLVDVYVKYVRDKIDTGFPVKLLRTIRGIGYVVAEN